MPKIIDSFLFFQELDLLEVRLRYLDPYVDVFLIVEAAQTFSGKPKDFVFARNRDRFAKYLPKIYYHQIHDSHADFASVVDWLGQQPLAAYQHVRALLLGHGHYPRSELRWVLDTYHRERIHVALADVSAPQDIVLLSDLDEVPDRAVFATAMAPGGQPQVCRQHEFRYYLNFYKDSCWLGTIVGRYEVMRGLSLNTLRVDSKLTRLLIAPEPIFPGGYHFTSCGGLDAIREKIRSWAHQEFNTSAVLSRLEENIRTGQDIFGREGGTTMTKLDLTGSLMDSRLAAIIGEYPALLYGGEIQQVFPGPWGRLWRKLYGLPGKVRFKLAERWRRLGVRARERQR